MKTIILAGVAGLAMTAAPAMAQNAQQTTGSMQQPMNQQGTSQTAGTPYSMNASQRATYDALPTERRQSYDAMNGQLQEYYFTLTPQQQEAFFLLNDEQRNQLYALPPEQRAQAWTSIQQQVAAMNQQNAAGQQSGSSAMETGSMASQDAMAQQGSMAATGNTGQQGAMAGQGTMNQQAMTSGNIRFVASERVQATPMDAGPPTGDVPVCRAGQTDNCMNAWEAGRRGPSVAKPLGYYPGEAGPNPRR